MEKPTGVDLLQTAAKAEPIARQLQALREGERPVVFSHVITSARAFLVATIARETRETLWIICPSVRTQELLHESLTNWCPDALFLPEAEFLAVENILPDQEIAAERLALLSRVEQTRQRRLIVATRASLEQPAPPRGALRAAALRLRRGASESLERIVESLGGSGYERVAQVIVDPTHGIGLREYIPQMALAAIAAGADAVMIEVHHEPERARSDGEQALRPEVFHDLVRRIRAVAEAVGREL